MKEQDLSEIVCCESANLSFATSIASVAYLETLERRLNQGLDDAQFCHYHYNPKGETEDHCHSVEGSTNEWAWRGVGHQIAVVYKR